MPRSGLAQDTLTDSSISRSPDRNRCAACGRLLPEKDAICPACVRGWQTFRRITVYLQPYKARLLLQVLVSLTLAAAGLVPPAITRLIIDHVLEPARAAAAPRLRALGFYVAALVAIRILTWALEWIHGWTVAWLGARVTADIRSQLYQRLEMLALRFYDNREIGALASRVSNDTATLQDFLIRGLPYLLINTVTLLGIFAVMLSMSWQLTLAVVLPVPILWIWAVLFWRRMRLVFHRWWQAGARFSAQLSESLSGIREVKAFGRQEREIARFQTHNANVFRRTVDSARNRVALVATMGIVTGAGVVLLWLLGGLNMGRNGLSVGAMVAFYNYLLLFYNPLQWFGQFSDWMARAFTGAERIFEILSAPAEAYNDPNAGRAPCIRGHVAFRDVTFGYDSSRPVLHEINFEARPGEMIGIVGKSGVGKTTAMNLLCRFYDVNAGAIEVDGMDIRRMRLEDLRSHIGIVLQDPVLFSGSIARNISYGRPAASLEEIIEAAKIANAHSFIMAKPDGYDTEVGERGSRLSVGERQRVAIARAILRDPSILILDEATSSVDALSENLIQEAIGRLAKERTSFVIAHRLSTLKNAGRLIVLDQGRVAEAGTYEQLMARRGRFHDLVRLQDAAWEHSAIGA